MPCMRRCLVRFLLKPVVRIESNYLLDFFWYSVPAGPAPQSVNVSSINATTYMVTWEQIPEDSRNGIVLKYGVRWILMRKTQREKRTVAKRQREFNGTTAGFNYTIHGLQLCAQYGISVRAYTSAGPGPYSEQYNITTQRKYLCYNRSLITVKYFLISIISQVIIEFPAR